MRGIHSELVEVAQHLLFFVRGRTEILIAIVLGLAQTTSEKLLAAAGKGRRGKVGGRVARAVREVAAVGHKPVCTRVLHARKFRGERKLRCVGRCQRHSFPVPAVGWSRWVIREAESRWAVE